MVHDPFVTVYVKTYGWVLAIKPFTTATLPVDGKGVGEVGPETKLQLPTPGEGLLPTRNVDVALHKDKSAPAFAAIDS